jgi:hypothetical protein
MISGIERLPAPFIGREDARAPDARDIARISRNPRCQLQAAIVLRGIVDTQVYELLTHQPYLGPLGERTAATRWGTLFDTRLCEDQAMRLREALDGVFGITPATATVRDLRRDVPGTRSGALVERNRRNPQLSPARRQFGVWCFALRQLTRLPGQQVVAVATEVLASHLVTGQSPAEDAHLGARLSWDAPQSGLAPDQVAACMRRHRGPSLLPVTDDARVDWLRTRVRRGTASPGEVCELERILHRAALDAWDLLDQAREVYRNLPFPLLPGLDVLTAASARELDRLLTRPTMARHHLAATRTAFLRQEAWRARLEDLDARGDPVQRALLRREGRVLATTILRARPGAQGQPVRILSYTDQPVLRIRPGTRLTTADARVTVIVEIIRHRPGGTLLLLRVTSGIRAARALPTNQVIDWFDTVIFAGKPGGTASHLPGIPLAVLVRTLPVSGSLLHVARRLRQP